MGRTQILAAALTAAVAIGVISPKVIAYATYGKWGTLSVDVYINPVNADVTQAAATAALQAGMNVWNTQSGTAFRFNYAGKVGDTTTAYDNRNVILFRNVNNGSTIASTYTWASNGVLVDTDTVFWDGGWQFFAGASGCTDGAYIEDIAAHELGHALGLEHSTQPDATMYGTYTRCSTSPRTLTSDDIAAVQSLYSGGAGKADTPPVLTILTPLNGTSASSSTLITFSATATDSPDGNISGNIVWTSNIDGQIGTGAQFSRALSPGSHTVTATIRDSIGFTIQQGVMVYVTAGGGGGTTQPPTSGGGTTQPPTSGGGTSADGTTVPSAPQIIDSSGAIWTLGASGAILRNGASAAGGYGSQILWKNGKIYVLGTDNRWYEWTGGGWLNVGTSVPGGTTQPPTSGGGTSADGTTVPSAPQIIDSSGAIWTLGASGAILRNGASAAGGYGSQILWKNGKIYVLGTDNRWYEWTGGGWLNVGTAVPGGTTQPPTSGGGTSADGTTVPSAPQIIDSSGAIWTLGASGAILRNGASAAGGYGSRILWKNGKIYVLGTDNRWYEWTGGGWLNVGTAVPGGTTQPPTSGGGTSADGTTIPSATQIIDSSGAIWTLGASGAILRNGASAAGGYGSQILWKNGKIYVLGTDNRWYEWTGAGWNNVGTSVPGGTNTSADGTTIPSAAQIIDSSGAIWTLGSNGAILKNGALAAGGYGWQILWKNGKIYVLGTDNRWYEWTGAGWLNVGATVP